jgi:hypothetical protein
MNKLPEAADAYKRAVAIKPDLLETYSNLSWTYDKLAVIRKPPTLINR